MDETPQTRDVDALSRELESVRRSETRLRAILNALQDPMVSIDDHGTITAASESVERVFGYAPSELIGRNVNVIMTEPHRANHDGYLANYRRTGHTGIIGRTREFDVVRKDGRVITVALSVSRADPEDGQKAVFTGTFRDITELREAHRRLAESEQRFHAIFEHAFQFVGLLRPDGTLVEVNRAALEAIGASREDVVGRPFWRTRFWTHSPELAAQVEDAVKRAAAGEFVRFEARHVAPDGSIVEVDFSLQPVRDEDGRVVLLIPEGRDISQIKRAQRSETAMLRAFATIGESAALLAHEIKNPITAVHMALRAVADQLGEDNREILEDLVARMQRIERMMQRTLSLAKPIELKPALVPVEDLVGRTLGHLADDVARAGATVTTKLDARGVRIEVDPQLLEEVLANLVSNAVEAQQPTTGGRGAQVLVEARVLSDGGLLLAVEDDGPGITSSAAGQIFKPFYSTKRKGNGLGLAICKKIVEEHGGTIGVVARNPGARFEVRLPKARVRRSSSDAAPRSTPA